MRALRIPMSMLWVSLFGILVVAGDLFVEPSRQSVANFNSGQANTVSRADYVALADESRDEMRRAGIGLVVILLIQLTATAWLDKTFARTLPAQK